MSVIFIALFSHSIPLMLSAFASAQFYHFLTRGKNKFSITIRIAHFMTIFWSQQLFHPFHSIILALLSFWPLVWVFSYFPQKSSNRVQGPLILKIISSTFTICKNMLNMPWMSPHKMGSFEIFISTVIGSSGGDEYRQLGVPENHPHQNKS